MPFNPTCLLRVCFVKGANFQVQRNQRTPRKWAASSSKHCLAGHSCQFGSGRWVSGWFPALSQRILGRKMVPTERSQRFLNIRGPVTGLSLGIHLAIQREVPTLRHAQEIDSLWETKFLLLNRPQFKLASSCNCLWIGLGKLPSPHSKSTLAFDPCTHHRAWHLGSGWLRIGLGWASGWLGHMARCADAFFVQDNCWWPVFALVHQANSVRLSTTWDNKAHILHLRAVLVPLEGLMAR